MAGSAVATAYVKVMPSMDGVPDQIEKEFTGQGQKAGGFFAGKFGAALKVGIGAAAVAAGVIIKESLEQGAALEQSIGGIETLFGAGGKSLEEYAASVGKTSGEARAEYNRLLTAQAEVFANAEEAYKTAGMSRNEYMENVTGFSASLISSLEGDTIKAASVADMALRDISDNANKMGSDTQSLTDAYKSMARGQYQLLDNLKLGYGGTKEEMERLLADAQALSGVEYDISSLADVYTAIHVIQEEMGITGTTAKEASSTLSGSFNAMKAAAQNVLGNLALGEPMEKSLGELWDTTKIFFGDNLLPMVGRVLEGLPECLEVGIRAMVTWLRTPGNVDEALGAAWDYGKELAKAIFDGFTTNKAPLYDEVAGRGVTFGRWRSGNGGSGKHGGSGGKFGGGLGGSFRNGLTYVPYDGFIAELHEGEQILTKSQANVYRAGQSGGRVQVNQYFYGSTHTAADEQQAARYELEKAVGGFV